MPWIAASLISALFLGIYQLSTKHAVHDNAVLPVLFLSNLCSATVWLALLCLDAAIPTGLPTALQVASLSGHDHLLLFVSPPSSPVRGGAAILR